MELPRRADGDILLPPGEMRDIRRRLRDISSRHDLATVIACAFDHRTRILPFVFADTRMVPAGVRAIGSAMVDCGFDKTRIVLQHWNRSFRPQQMRLDGRVPDIFMVSSLLHHARRCDELIQDVNAMDPSVRPLIIAGGPRVIYSPWEVFGADPDHPWAVWAAKAIERTTGERTVVVPNSGGSICNYIFEEYLGLPTIWIPLSYAGCSQHAPNEHVLMPLCREALALMAGLYWDLGEGGTPPARAAS